MRSRLSGLVVGSVVLGAVAQRVRGNKIGRPDQPVTGVIALIVVVLDEEQHGQTNPNFIGRVAEARIAVRFDEISIKEKSTIARDDCHGNTVLTVEISGCVQGVYTMEGHFLHLICQVETIPLWRKTQAVLKKNGENCTKETRERIGPAVVEADQ